ncbi:MAG: hypothetical protein RIM83_14585 [Allomuricauda sp.]
MQKGKNARNMITKVKCLSAFLLILLMVFSCATVEIQSSEDAYEVINSYYRLDEQNELGKKTVDISQYKEGLDDISVWQNANTDLGNMNKPEVDFLSLFGEDEFAGIIREFTEKNPLQLKRNKLKRSIKLKNKAKNLISFPHVFSKNGKKYALMYAEVTEGPESGAGGITLFRMDNDGWKDIFYLHLWIS